MPLVENHHSNLPNKVHTHKKLQKMRSQVNFYETYLNEKSIGVPDLGDSKLIKLPTLKDKKSFKDTKHDLKVSNNQIQLQNCVESEPFMDRMCVDDLAGSNNLNRKDKRRHLKSRRQRTYLLNFTKQMLNGRVQRQLQKFQLKYEPRNRNYFDDNENIELKNEEKKVEKKKKFKLVETNDSSHIPKSILNLVTKSKSDILMKRTKEKKLSINYLTPEDRSIINEIREMPMKKKRSKISFGLKY